MSLLDRLVQLELSQLAAFMRPQTLDIASLEPSEWLALVQMLTTRIIEESEELDVEEWESCSSALTHALHAAQSLGTVSHVESVIRRVNLTAALLHKVASNDAIALLNARKAADLAFGEISISTGEAMALASRWRELSISQIRELRTIKNLLAPLLAMQDSLDDSRLAAWEPIYPLLP